MMRECSQFLLFNYFNSEVQAFFLSCPDSNFAKLKKNKGEGYVSNEKRYDRSKICSSAGLSHLKAPAGQDKARTGVYKHLFIL